MWLANGWWHRTRAGYLVLEGGYVAGVLGFKRLDSAEQRRTSALLGHWLIGDAGCWVQIECSVRCNALDSSSGHSECSVLDVRWQHRGTDSAIQSCMLMYNARCENTWAHHRAPRIASQLPLRTLRVFNIIVVPNFARTQLVSRNPGILLGVFVPSRRLPMLQCAGWDGRSHTCMDVAACGRKAHIDCSIKL